MSAVPVAVVQPDRRENERYVTLYRAGKLTHGEDEQLVMLRNVSANGAMVNHNGRFAVDDRVTLDLRLDERLSGRVAWVKDDRIGIAFLEPTDLARLLARHERERFKPRAPRLRVTAPVELRLETGPVAGVLRDLSQHGACVAPATPLPPIPELRLVLPEFGNYRAIVRWRRGGFIGLNFVSTLPMWDLNNWVRAQRQG